MPLVSVIIPTYHRNDLLAKCLDCLAPGVQTLAIEHYEVIVTDDGSQTTAQTMIQKFYPWAKWVAGSRQGPAANRNNGARYAQGEWLAFTDDDCLPDPQWLEAYTQAIVAESSCLIFEGRVYVDCPRRSLAETSPTNELGGYLWSCNFIIHRQIFKSLGGFDERFPYAAMEDVELRQRIIKSGQPFKFVRSASVCHPWTAKKDWEQLKQHQTSTLIYLSIHPEEIANINSLYYLKFAVYGLVKSTIPEIINQNCCGLKYAILEHISFLQMSFFLLIYPVKINKNKR
ncbi:MAG: glycosyltransferase [Coleofasciculus chthonoplastes F3-SA18-01]|uniref:glycosyltransferase family 2 protein n=1 Tax=Coleofasciculus chthonoplastes TaxID=64178 RepID=UPI0032F5FF99